MNLKPLNVIKKRKVKTMPPHFSRIEVHEFDLLDNRLESWIVSKLNGRYSIVKQPFVKDNALKSSIFVGFEEHQESTFFTLACPFYRRTQ